MIRNLQVVFLILGIISINLTAKSLRIEPR